MIVVAVITLWACGGQNTASQDQTAGQEEEVSVTVDEPTMVALAEFKDKAESLVGKEVLLEGTVIHVCRHGGKKMFITADDPDVRIKITTGEDMVVFDPELEGSYIKVYGIVEAIEAEVVGEGQLSEEGEAVAEGEAGHVEDADHANIYHVPQYSVICIEYTVEDTEPSGE